jgi:hypothetical protein
MPNTLLDWLEKRSEIDQNIFDPDTLDQMSEAWQAAQIDALKTDRKIKKSRRLKSTTDIIGHVINLAVCLEAVLNLHLFFLVQSDRLSPENHNSIDKAEIISKLLFCFKEEISSKKLHIDRIKQLIRLRNNSVHYRIDTPDSLNPSVEELLGIWKQLGTLFSLTTGEPTQANIHDLSQKFMERWIA